MFQIDPGMPPSAGSAFRCLKAGLVAALLAAMGTLFMTNKYTSVATLLPQPRLRSNGLAMGLSMLGISGGAGLDAFGDQQGFRELNILDSRWMATRLLQPKYVFGYRSWYLGSRKQVETNLYDFLEAKDMDQAVKILNKWVDASRDLKSGLITLKVQAPSPELAQQISTNALQALDKFLEEETRAEGAKKARFFRDRLTDVQNQALEVERKLTFFAARNLNYQTSPSSEVRLEGARLEAELQGMRQLVSSMGLSLQQAMVDESNTMPVITILDTPSLPARKSGPFRSLIVMATFMAVAAGAWLIQHWRWLASRLDGLEADQGPGMANGQRG